MTSLITIGVPVYGVSDYIERCLSSLWALTVPENHLIQVIIVDDGSPDDSMEKVASSVVQAPPEFLVEVLTHGRNLGLAEARNTILNQARGHSLWFVDSDDRVHPEMLAEMVRAMTDDVDIVITGSVALNEAGESLSVGSMPYSRDLTWSGFEAVNELLAFRVWAFMWNKLIRTHLYRDLVFPRARTYEDSAVMAVLLARARRVALVAHPLYYYSIRSGAITDGLRVQLLDLSRNVRHAASLLEIEFPLLAADPAVGEYVARVAHLSPLHQAAALAADDDVSTIIRREVRADIRLPEVIAAFRTGRRAIGSALLVAKISPLAYMITYRIASRRRAGRVRSDAPAMLAGQPYPLPVGRSARALRPPSSVRQDAPPPPDHRR